MDINETKKNLEKILAKETLNLPLDDHEKAVLNATIRAEIAQKAEFVKTYLSPLLIHANVGVTNAEYIAEKDDEWVILTYERSIRKKRVNVSCDSLITLVTDVIAGIHGGGLWE